MPDRASVSVGLWVGVGGRYEPAELNGVCHFIEHMVFKGTGRRTAREISQAVEGIGGYLNAFTGEEHTCFYARARHDHLDDLLDVLADMLLHSKFTVVDVDKERHVIKEELAMYLDQPQQHVQELLNATLWPNHPLGRPLTGTPASLDQIGRPELLRFHRTHYVAPAALLVAAGQVRHADFVRRVQRLVAGFPQGARPTFAPSLQPQDRPRLRLHGRDTEQAQLALGIRICDRHDPRRFALRLLHTMLGENMSSRLFQVVREDRGLAYSIYSALSYFHDAGALVVSAGLDTGHLAKTLRLILVELRRLASRAPSRSELLRARDYVIGQMDLGLEGTENQMLWVGEQLLNYGRVLSPAAVRRRLAAVTPRDIQAAARDFFRADRFSLALVSPLKSARSLQRQLEQYG